jgi:F0F1-type ATP synthase assembly protein I
VTGGPWWATALKLTGLGWYVAACIVIGVAGGVLLDRWLGTLPIFTLVGTIGGSVIAFWGVFRMVLPVLYGANHRTTYKDRRND